MLRLSRERYHEVLNYLKTGKKIQAIKVVKSENGCGLKEAKLAIDRLQIERCGGKGVVSPEAQSIICGPRILVVRLDYGDGPVELDVEAMELRALTELGCIGLDACTHMLDIVDVFKAINEGKKITIGDDIL